MFTARVGRKQARDTVKDVEAQLADAVSMLRAAVSERGGQASALFSDAEDAMRTTMGALQSLQERTVQGARRGVRVTDEYVSDHPWQMVGVGAAVGFLIGAVISRR